VGQSKIENEEAVSRCKDRKLYMKEVVSFGNSFAVAHSSYATSLKNTGATLREKKKKKNGSRLAEAVGVFN